MIFNKHYACNLHSMFVENYRKLNAIQIIWYVSAMLDAIRILVLLGIVYLSMGNSRNVRLTATVEYSQQYQQSSVWHRPHRLDKIKKKIRKNINTEKIVNVFLFSSKESLNTNTHTLYYQLRFQSVKVVRIVTQLQST